MTNASSFAVLCRGQGWLTGNFQSTRMNKQMLIYWNWCSRVFWMNSTCKVSNYIRASHMFVLESANTDNKCLPDPHSISFGPNAWGPLWTGHLHALHPFFSVSWEAYTFHPSHMLLQHCLIAALLLHHSALGQLCMKFVAAVCLVVSHFLPRPAKMWMVYWPPGSTCKRILPNTACCLFPTFSIFFLNCFCKYFFVYYLV